MAVFLCSIILWNGGFFMSCYFEKMGFHVSAFSKVERRWGIAEKRIKILFDIKYTILSSFCMGLYTKK